MKRLYFVQCNLRNASPYRFSINASWWNWKKKENFNTAGEADDISWRVIYFFCDWREYRIWNKHNLNICEIWFSSVYAYKFYCFLAYEAVILSRNSTKVYRKYCAKFIGVENVVYFFSLKIEARRRAACRCEKSPYFLTHFKTSLFRTQ